MARYERNVNYGAVNVFTDGDTTVPIQDPTKDGGPLALGSVFVILDNLGTAGAHNIAITGPIAGGASATSITANYGSRTLRWMGTTYAQT